MCHFQLPQLKKGSKRDLLYCNHKFATTSTTSHTIDGKSQELSCDGSGGIAEHVHGDRVAVKLASNCGDTDIRNIIDDTYYQLFIWDGQFCLSFRHKHAWNDCMILVTELGTIHCFGRVHRVQVIYGEISGCVPAQSRQCGVLEMGEIFLSSICRISWEVFKYVEPPLFASAVKEGMLGESTSQAFFADL